MNKKTKIYIAGHRGLAGSAIVRELQRQGYTNLVTRIRAELDLEDAAATQHFFFEQERPELVSLYDMPLNYSQSLAGVTPSPGWGVWVGWGQTIAINQVRTILLRHTQDRPSLPRALRARG